MSRSSTSFARSRSRVTNAIASTLAAEEGPAKRHISPSYVERQNLAMRMNMRRFTRLTNAFSSKIENRAAAVALHCQAYTFRKPHKTLTKARKGYPTTPAMRQAWTTTSGRCARSRSCSTSPYSRAMRLLRWLRRPGVLWLLSTAAFAGWMVLRYVRYIQWTRAVYCARFGETYPEPCLLPQHYAATFFLYTIPMLFALALLALSVIFAVVVWWTNRRQRARFAHSN